MLAKERSNGYVWFMLMNVCAGSLMFAQDRYLLFIQQLLSLGFVIDAFVSERRARVRSAT